VPSSIIGGKVMDKLYQIDPVAYVRYVSVYRQFENVNEFIQEIQALTHRAAADPLQKRLFQD
jgi:transcriptional repressor NrdR